MNTASDNDEIKGPFGSVEVDFCDEKKRCGLRRPVFEVRFPIQRHSDDCDMPESLLELCVADDTQCPETIVDEWYVLRFRGQRSFRGSPIQLSVSSRSLGQDTADFGPCPLRGMVVVPEGAKWMIVTGLSRLPLELRLPDESEFVKSNPLTVTVAKQGSDLCESYALTRHGLGDDYSSPHVTTLDRVTTRIQVSKCITPPAPDYPLDKERTDSPYRHINQKEAIAVLLKMVQSKDRSK